MVSCDDDATKALWRLMYDRLVKTHGLNNLIWVWTAQYQAGYEALFAAQARCVEEHNAKL